MNLRGKFTTDKDGRFSFRSIKPAGYPIPINGPVGDLLQGAGPPQHAAGAPALPDLQGRAARPTSRRSICRTIRTSRPTCSSASRRRLLGDYVRHENEKPPAPGVKDPWFSLDYTFIMEPGTAKLPRAPIQDKATTDGDAAAVPAGDQSPAGDGEVTAK